MKIYLGGRQLAIDQCEYLKKVLKYCRMINAKPARTLLLEGYKHSTSTAPVSVLALDMIPDSDWLPYYTSCWVLAL